MFSNVRERYFELTNEEFVDIYRKKIEYKGSSRIPEKDLVRLAMLAREYELLSEYYETTLRFCWLKVEHVLYRRKRQELIKHLIKKIDRLKVKSSEL